MRPQLELMELMASGASDRVAQLQYDRLRLVVSQCHMTSTRLLGEHTEYHTCIHIFL